MPLKTHLAEEPVINMMPLIDIVFWLLVYFLLGTKFTEMERHIELKVPQVAEAGGAHRRAGAESGECLPRRHAHAR